MKRPPRETTLVMLGLAAALAAVGCTKYDPSQLIGGSTSNNPCPAGGTGPGGAVGSGSGSSGATGSTGSGSVTPPKTVLDERVLSYTEALRTASFKLVGNAPTLKQILDLSNAPDQAKAYADMVDGMMADPRFSARMIAFWRNTMRMGGAAAGGKPSRETAPTFAARITVEGQPYSNLFTATNNTCPTFDGTKFVDGDCAPNGPADSPTVGILTDAGVEAQYYGNMAFRRVRFFQETFACRKQPAELSDMPKPIGNNGATYTSPWPFESVAGTDNGGQVDFHDVSSAICANCHTTSNHRAPLFGNFDDKGKYQPTIQVQTPVAGLPTTVLSDWLPQTPTAEPTAWKFGVPAKNLTEMGAAMAADEEVLNCAVFRVWNYAMSKGDIVNDAATVPTEVVAPYLKNYKAGGYNLRNVIRAIFVSDDFVRF